MLRYSCRPPDKVHMYALHTPQRTLRKDQVPSLLPTLDSAQRADFNFQLSLGHIQPGLFSFLPSLSCQCLCSGYASPFRPIALLPVPPTVLWFHRRSRTVSGCKTQNTSLEAYMWHCAFSAWTLGRLKSGHRLTIRDPTRGQGDKN